MNNAARKQKRFFAILALMIAAGCVAALILSALNDNIVFFLTPSDMLSRHYAPERRLRLGGMVEQGSVRRKGTITHFVVTDGKQKLAVVYEGPLPDLFREGQGVVAEGRLRGDGFAADTVLAKHDEKYMPREVADALKKQGYWQTHAPAPESERK